METGTEVLIATEYCPGGTLSDVVYKREQPLHARQVVSTFRQCCQAVEHLHLLDPPLIHRDIKLENFLLAADHVVKLCDFGSATTRAVDPSNLPFAQLRTLEDEMERHTTPQNRSPEMLDLHKGHVVDTKVDMWALGCLLFALCYRVHPFQDAAKLQILNAGYKLPKDTDYVVFHDLIRS